MAMQYEGASCASPGAEWNQSLGKTPSVRTHPLLAAVSTAYPSASFVSKSPSSSSGPGPVPISMTPMGFPSTPLEYPPPPPVPPRPLSNRFSHHSAPLVPLASHATLYDHGHRHGHANKYNHDNLSPHANGNPANSSHPHPHPHPQHYHSHDGSTPSATATATPLPNPSTSPSPQTYPYLSSSAPIQPSLPPLWPPQYSEFLIPQPAVPPLEFPQPHPHPHLQPEPPLSSNPLQNSQPSLPTNRSHEQPLNLQSSSPIASGIHTDTPGVPLAYSFHRPLAQSGAVPLPTSGSSYKSDHQQPSSNSPHQPVYSSSISTITSTGAGFLSSVNGQNVDEDEALRIAIARSLSLEEENRLSREFWERYERDRENERQQEAGRGGGREGEHGEQTELGRSTSATSGFNPTPGHIPNELPSIPSPSPSFSHSQPPIDNPLEIGNPSWSSQAPNGMLPITTSSRHSSVSSRKPLPTPPMLSTWTNEQEMRRSSFGVVNGTKLERFGRHSVENGNSDGEISRTGDAHGNLVVDGNDNGNALYRPSELEHRQSTTSSRSGISSINRSDYNAGVGIAAHRPSLASLGAESSLSCHSVTESHTTSQSQEGGDTKLGDVEEEQGSVGNDVQEPKQEVIRMTCCYDKPGITHSEDSILRKLPNVISLLPQPWTFQMISSSFQEILREIVAERGSRIEPHPATFDQFRSVCNPQFQLIITFRFIELRSVLPSRKGTKFFDSRKGREKLSRYLPGGAFRTVMVLEVDEYRKRPAVAEAPALLQRSSSSLNGYRSSDGTNTSDTPVSRSVLRNPLLPHERVVDTLVLKFLQPLLLPITNEALVERLHAHLKNGKTVSASTRSPEPGTVEENALQLCKFAEKYPGPSDQEGCLSRPHKLDKSDDYANGEDAERHAKRPFRSGFSKIIGAVQSKRPETIDDERESWITPFKMEQE